MPIKLSVTQNHIISQLLLIIAFATKLLCTNENYVHKVIATIILNNIAKTEEVESCKSYLYRTLNGHIVQMWQAGGVFNIKKLTYLKIRRDI